MCKEESDAKDGCDEFGQAELREEEQPDTDNSHAERTRAFIEQCRAELEEEEGGDDDE